MSKSINWTNHLIELIIVIIGISIAFWLNSLAEESKEKKLEASFIKEIRADLLKDSVRLQESISFNEKKIAVLQRALELIKNDTRQQYPDSAFQYAAYVGNYVFFYPDNFTLASLLQSGDIKHLKSTALKKELQRLMSIYEQIETMQQNFLSALDDNYFPRLMQHVDLMTYQIEDPSFIYTLEVRNYCAYAMADSGNHNASYEHAIAQIRLLLSMM